MTDRTSIAPRAALRAASGSTVRGRRVVGLLITLVSAAVLLIAAWLEPSPKGLGTHSQSGMPPCGWISSMDLPCPTCGMTTAFAHAADGNILAAVVTQPLGGVLAICTAMAFLLGAYTVITGSAVFSSLRRLWGRHTGWWVGAIVILAWVYKIISYKGLLG